MMKLVSHSILDYTLLMTICSCRQGMAPVLEMAMVAKLLMILIDTTMMWDVPKKRPDKLHHGKVAVYSA